jgi:hypothetical protein
MHQYLPWESFIRGWFATSAPHAQHALIETPPTEDEWPAIKLALVFPADRPGVTIAVLTQQPSSSLRRRALPAQMVSNQKPPRK